MIIKKFNSNYFIRIILSKADYGLSLSIIDPRFRIIKITLSSIANKQLNKEKLLILFTYSDYLTVLFLSMKIIGLFSQINE